MKLKDISVAAFVLLLAALLAFFWLSPSGLKAAPSISLTSLDSTPIALDNYRGRPLLITFWATSCPGCIKEMPHLVELYHELGPKGLAIVAIAMDYDPPQHVAEMVRQRGLPYVVAHDLDGSAAKAFGDVKLTPTSFLIDPQGRIVQQKLGEMEMGELRTRILGMLAQARAGA